jgi:thiazole synthase ThiGH ThiG subunit
VNTALARAPRPELLAASMRHAAQAGLLAYRAAGAAGPAGARQPGRLAGAAAR